MSGPDSSFRCLVVDDDPVSRALVEHFVQEHPALTLVDSCESAIQAVNSLSRETIDVIFLDIEMPEMTGLELIQSLDHRPQIILITGKQEYAVEAFDVNVVDYLLKPVSYARFIKAVSRLELPTPLEPGTENTHDSVFVKTGGRLVQVDLNSLFWIEAQGDYALMHAGGEDLLVHGTMKKFAQKLPENDFLRVHRSYIVRVDKIEDIEDASLVIGRKLIPIGASYRDQLLKRIKML